MVEKILLSLLTIFFVKLVSAQPPLPISFTFDLGDGLIYVLITIFFGVTMITPCMKFIYVRYLTKLFDRAGKELSKVSKRLSDRLSDAGRRVSSVRTI